MDAVDAERLINLIYSLKPISKRAQWWCDMKALNEFNKLRAKNGLPELMPERQPDGSLLVIIP